MAIAGGSTDPGGVVLVFCGIFFLLFPISSSTSFGYNNSSLNNNATCASYANCNMSCKHWYDYNTDVIIDLSGTGPGYDEVIG